MEAFLPLLFFFKDFIYLFLDRGEGREKERERNINVWLPLVNPLCGTWPTTQACALTGIELATLWFSGWCSIQSHTSLGPLVFFKMLVYRVA